MNINLTQDLCHAIGLKDLKPYGIDADRFKWDKGTEINLANFSTAKCLDLRNLIEPFTVTGGAIKTIKGAGLAVRDITIWLNAIKDAGAGTPRNVHQFYSMLKRYLLKQVPGQRLFFRDDEKECWWCYYATEVEYRPRYEDRGNVYPAHCDIHVVWWEFGKLKKMRHVFYDDDVRGRSVAQALAGRHGFISETAELRAMYETTIARYNENVMETGRQFWAMGTATDDLDGNPSSGDGWWSRRTNTIHLDKGGERSRVVIDVFREDDKEEREREEDFNEHFWHYEARKKFTSDGDEEDESELEATDYDEDFTAPVVPIHPTCAVFDLRRHLRLQVHIDQLERYVYDRTLGDKLVLPADDRALVEILLADDSEFADIIAGKGGSSIVLCTGEPGLGKTLTAEVYAEVTERPLFSVQCSQLGIQPSVLEDNMLKNFARAERWNAILLLDEADVYIAPRGSNLVQNAIVGVFLRTLEYYKGVMFMTTNRADLVDDAIASRCIARLTYSTPDAKAQLRIWNIMSSLSGGVMREAEARKVVASYPDLSGRDVKNLLKLGILVAKARKELGPNGEPRVTADTITFVKRFKPTADLPTRKKEDDHVPK